LCAQLGIELIAANSPQAKGRVERVHGTHQDRLVKKLRRKKIATHAQANAYLEGEYLAEHNCRFARAAARREDYHRRAPRPAECARGEDRDRVGHSADSAEGEAEVGATDGPPLATGGATRGRGASLRRDPGGAAAVVGLAHDQDKNQSKNKNQNKKGTLLMR
jgi:hypothetical protein